MKAYWDSSALVEALQNPKSRQALARQGGWTRTHSLSEVFSTLTGGRLGLRTSAEDAIQLLEDLAQDLEFVDLDAAQTFRALGKAKRLGVRGGLVHDLLHVEAALLAGAKKIVTLNIEDFRGIRQGMVVSNTG